MKVKELIRRLLNHDMDAKVELVIFGKDKYQEMRYSCFLKNDCIEDGSGFRNTCPLIFHTDEISDSECKGDTLHEIMLNAEFYFNEWLKNKKEKEKSDDRSNTLGNTRSTQ